MRRVVLLLSVVFVATSSAGRAQAPAAAPSHAGVTPRDMKWAPAPPALPPGAQAVVLAGDPGKEGIFVIRLKLPAGYRVPPHWHPSDELVTVLSGTLQVGGRKGRRRCTMSCSKVPRSVKVARVGSCLPCDVCHSQTKAQVAARLRH